MAGELPRIPFLEAVVGSTPARNETADVLWVQGLLGQWLKSKGKPALGLDGTCGRNTISVLLEFQRQEMKLQNPEPWVVPEGAVAFRLLAQRPSKIAKITTGSNFIVSEGGVVLNRVLLVRVLRLCQALIDMDLVGKNIRLNQGVRAPATAHRWSTSWNIRKRRVPLSALQALKGGKDLDGNLWYDETWDSSAGTGKKDKRDPESLKKLWQQIDANAAIHYASDAIAAEGYRLSDPRSKPNVHKAVSNHIDGRAIDVSIPWKAGAQVFGKKITKGATSEEAANAVVRSFRLSRPVKSERWHFQLPADESRGFISENNLTVGGPSTGEGPQDG